MLKFIKTIRRITGVALVLLILEASWIGADILGRVFQKRIMIERQIQAFNICMYILLGLVIVLAIVNIIIYFKGRSNKKPIHSRINLL